MKDILKICGLLAFAAVAYGACYLFIGLMYVAMAAVPVILIMLAVKWLFWG